MIGKAIKYYKEGNLTLAIKFKLNKWLDRRIASEEKKRLAGRILNRFYIRNDEEAFEFLFRQATAYAKRFEGKKIILFGQISNPEVQKVFRKLLNNGFACELQDAVLFNVKQLEESAGNIACFVSLYFKEKINQGLSSKIILSHLLRDIPFEYLGDTRVDFAEVRQQDHQDSLDFVSPLLAAPVNYFEIYRESLQAFEKKCDIRDYMDLCQLITLICDRKIPGDVAEFGSYKGHSGYLISQLLKANGSDKKLYMFDTFEKFPVENIGVDAFWSDTHEVNYEEVKSKFKGNERVKLVKGDFTKTLEGENIKQLSFIYIDCDSYRATTFLMEKLFDEVLSPGGLLVLEDYGHPALLGNRLAYHHFFDNRKNNFRFFSQFSGFQIIVK